VPEEGQAELGIATDPLEPGIGVKRSLLDGVRAEVGQFPGLEVAPDHLDRVQVVRVGGQPFDDEMKAFIALLRCEGRPSQMIVTLSPSR